MNGSYANTFLINLALRALQVFGFLNLFGPFIPIALGAMRSLPIIGDILSLPVIAPAVDRIAGGQTSRRPPV
jgi:hypothetical protein